MKIIFKEDALIEFNKCWQQYIDNNIASYRYLPVFLEYMLFYSNNLLYDKSFVLIENNECVGVCFLPVEKYENNMYISLSEGYTIAPLAKNKRIEKKIYETIDALAHKLNIAKIKFYSDPLIIEYSDKFNALLKYGYIDSSSTDCLLNLKKDEKTLWQNLRKSYKALINSYLKNDDFEIVIMDKENANYELHENYRELHKKCSGRVTRAKETFDKQYELLENGFSLLFGLKFKGKYIGFNYFIYFQKTVVYGSAADDPDYETMKIPIFHILLWKATVYFKEKGYEYIHYSQPCGYSKINGFDDYLDDKQINISHFKRGMGTDMVPLFRGIKYYDKNLLLEDVEKFRENILKNY